jgi:DNA-binding transcriptional LysR family regulator
VTVASRDYVRRRGAPDVPAELTAHDCIIYTRLATGNRWHFEGRDGPITVDVKGRFAADNSEAVREAVLTGLGIAVVPVWLFPDQAAHRHVRILLRAFEPTQLPIHAVYSSRRQLSTKVRAMIDFLAAEFEKSPTLSTNAHTHP